MTSATVRTALSVAATTQALRHVASLFETTLGVGATTVDVPVALANPALAVQLGAEKLATSIDQHVRLRVSVQGCPGAQTVVTLESEPPLYYFTGAYGFTSDCVTSFATTLQATLDAQIHSTKLPTFPAPPRPPGA